MVGFTQSTNQHFYGQMSLIVQSNTTQICGNQQKNMNNKNTVFLCGMSNYMEFHRYTYANENAQ